MFRLTTMLCPDDSHAHDTLGRETRGLLGGRIQLQVDLKVGIGCHEDFDGRAARPLDQQFPHKGCNRDCTPGQKYSGQSLEPPLPQEYRTTCGGGPTSR